MATSSRPSRLLAAFGLLGACTASVPPVPAPVTHRPAVVQGELRGSTGFRAQAVSLSPVVLVQAEVSGPGLAQPLVASAAVGSDRRFAIPFASVPLGENRPVRVVGFTASGRAVPGVVLEGWLSVRSDGTLGETSAAATPVGATYRRLWQLAGSEPIAGVIAQALPPAALQAHVVAMSESFSRDYSLIDGPAIAGALLNANRSRTTLDIAGSVTLPAPDGSQIRHPALVRGTLWQGQGGETLTSMTVDDPLSPEVRPLPTTNGAPFRVYPVVPGLRQLTMDYTAGTPMQRHRFSRSFVASEDVETVIDAAVATLSPRQVPPGGTLALQGHFFGAASGTAALRQSPTPVSLEISAWSDSSIRLSLPATVQAGVTGLEVSGSDWALDVDPLTILAGPPLVSSAVVNAVGGGRQLVLAGANFSAYGGDHRLVLIGTNGAETVLAALRDGANLVAALPASLLAGNYQLKLSIGGVAAASPPTITL